MNAFTKLSDKGQVVVPKATRDRMGWAAGLDLEVIEMMDSITLRPRRPAKSLTMAEAIERLRAIRTHDGPPATLDDMRDAVQDAVDARWQPRG